MLYKSSIKIIYTFIKLFILAYTTRKHIFYEGGIRCKFVVIGALRRINIDTRFVVKRSS